MSLAVSMESQTEPDDKFKLCDYIKFALTGAAFGGFLTSLGGRTVMAAPATDVHQ